MICGHQAGRCGCLVLDRARRLPDVVDSLVDHDVADARLRQDVAAEAAERAGARPVAEDAIAADALVGDGDRRGFGDGLEAGEELVRPSENVVVSAGHAYEVAGA